MRGDDVNRNPTRTLTAALALVAALGLTPGCRRAEETPARKQAPAAEPAGPPSPEVQAAVQGVLDSGRHPWLTWPDVTGVLPRLKALYAAEPDGLFWFAGASAHPALAGALDTLAHADTQGLNPADYDAAAPGQEVGGDERRRGPLPRRPRALRRGPHRLRDASALSRSTRAAWTRASSASTTT